MKKYLLLTTFFLSIVLIPNKAIAQYYFQIVGWDSLSSGMGGTNPEVRALALHDSNVYSSLFAGGDFLQSGK